MAFHSFTQKKRALIICFPTWNIFCPSHRRKLVPLSKQICITSNCWECLPCVFENVLISIHNKTHFMLCMPTWCIFVAQMICTCFAVFNLKYSYSNGGKKTLIIEGPPSVLQFRLCFIVHLKKWFNYWLL